MGGPGARHLEADRHRRRRTVSAQPDFCRRGHRDRHQHPFHGRLVERRPQRERPAESLQTVDRHADTGIDAVERLAARALQGVGRATTAARSDGDRRARTAVLAHTADCLDPVDVRAREQMDRIQGFACPAARHAARRRGQVSLTGTRCCCGREGRRCTETRAFEGQDANELVCPEDARPRPARRSPS